MEEKKGTSFEELYDLCLSTCIDDFRLDNLYINNKEMFFVVLKQYLAKAVLECAEDFITKNLAYNDLEENIGTDDNPVIVERTYFEEFLHPTEKLILINFIAIYWYEKKMRDSKTLDKKIGTKSARDMNTDITYKLKLQDLNEQRSENYANIRKLQNGHLDEIGWGQW